MANFNIDASLSNGKRIDWLALPDKGETAEQVERAIRAAACKKFGGDVFFRRWDRVVAANGYITVRMYA